MLTHGIPPALCDGAFLYRQGPVPSLQRHALSYRWRSLPKVRWPKASSPQSSSTNGCCLFRYHNGPIHQGLSFPTPDHGQLNGDFVFSPENVVSRDSLSRPIPRRPAQSPNIGWLNLVLTHGIFPAFREGGIVYRQPPSGQFRVYRVTQLHTDGVHAESPPAQGQ